MTEQISNERLDVKPLDLSMLLRDAFLAGRGLKDGDKLSEDDLAAWSQYDPEGKGPFERIDAALKSLRSVNGIEPMGDWVVVPRIETDEMCEAGLEALRENLGHEAVIVRDAAACYRAMLHAVPQPAKGVGEDMVERAAKHLCENMCRVEWHSIPEGSSEDRGFPAWKIYGHYNAGKEDYRQMVRAALEAASLSHNEKATEQSSGGEVWGTAWQTSYTADQWHFARTAAFSSTDIECGVVKNITRLYAAPPKPATDTLAARDVLAERRRQTESEGWTPEHDDRHSHGELALAAAAYAYGSQYPDDLRKAVGRPNWWPWDAEWWKPKDARRDLVKAAALTLAEIERIDRLSSLQSVTDTLASKASETGVGDH